MKFDRGTTITVDGVSYALAVERRKRGTGSSTRFYTWVYATPSGATPSKDRDLLGDPWPCVNPKRSEVEAAIRCAARARKGLA